MKPALYTLIYLLTLNLLHSQEHFPGGVSKPVLWQKSQQNPSTKKTKLTTAGNYPMDLNLAKESRPLYLNGHPSYYLDGQTGGVLSYTSDQLKQMTLFLVYQVQDTIKEKNIWNIETEKQTEKILTTHRLADLPKGKYLNYLKGRQKTAEIHTYQQYNQDSLVSQKHLYLGKSPLQSHLPIENFKGIIPEVLLYDRVLSAKERTQVESYLAIKYGIPIYQGGDPKDYLDSEGRIIWSGAKNTNYNRRVTGIGKDLISGLEQTQSSSSLEPGIFSLWFSNSQNVSDKNFILWGDNGEPLEIQKTKQGQPKGIARQWKITGTQTYIPFSFSIDTQTLSGVLSPEEYYWLAIDKSGTGDYPKGQTQYRKLGLISSLSEIKIENQTLEKTTDKAVVLSIKSAPEMFAQAWISQPDCIRTKRGSIDFKIEGGSAPFELSLIRLFDNLTQNFQINTHTEIQSIPYLEAGEYHYSVQDSQGKTYQETLSIESSDAPQSAMKNEYYLVEGKKLILDALISDTHCRYQWFNEQGQLISGISQVSLEKAGIYKLKITNEQGCFSTKTIKITGQNANNFKSVELFPNPSIGGDYYLHVLLLRKAPVSIKMYDSVGRLLHEEEVKGDNYYMYQGKAPAQGMYYIHLQSENSKVTEKLLVQ